MQSIKPRTYNELMQYKRCLELKRFLTDMDDTLFAKTYWHMVETNHNSIGISDGKMVFYTDGNAIETIAVSVGVMITAIRLTATALDVQRPYSYHSAGDGGSSGNNNNNNNNNNA